MAFLFPQQSAIFTIVILLVSYETTCWPRDVNKQGIDSALPRWNLHAAETNSLSNNVASRSKRQIAIDECCVKRRIYLNGRVSFECRSDHPDCFAKSNSSSPSFGLCESVRNSQNVVINCRCAARI